MRLPKVTDDPNDSESNKDVVHEIERQIGDVLSALSIPKELNPGSTGLVQRGKCSNLTTECKLHPPAFLLMTVYHLAFSFISGSQHNLELSIALDATGSHTSMWVQFMFLDEACMCYFLVF